MERNISILWDFDGTLAPNKDFEGNYIDSTSQVVKILSQGKEDIQVFWSNVKKLKGNNQNIEIQHVLASDTPIWMYALSQLAHQQNIPLNQEFFAKFVKSKIKLYPDVIPCLEKIKNIEKDNRFKEAKIKIHHFIISAGLKDLIMEIFPKKLITFIFGCRYQVISDSNNWHVSIPIFCMDETMKTRSIFEISKGTFRDPNIRVNKRISSSELWSQYSDMIYIGDGPTDIPALSLLKDRGGYGAIVYNNRIKNKDHLKDLSLDKRANIIAQLDFSTKGELFKFIKTRCYQILQSYEANDFVENSGYKLKRKCCEDFT